MIDLHLSLPAEIVEEVGALAEQLGQPRSDLMLRALQLGLEQLRLQKARQVNARSRSSSPAGRLSPGRRGMPWRCPGDWETYDKLEEHGEGFVEANPQIGREDLRRELMRAVGNLPAEDPAEVVERALNRVLGRPGAERPRPVPGDASTLD